VLVANVSDVDLDEVLNSVNVEKISPVLRNQRVYELYVRAERY
jgi:hypothetical protein